MSADYEIYKGKGLSDLFKKIDDNQARNKIQIESLIQEMMVYIKDPQSAQTLFPMISDFMESNIRNDELLVKLGAVVQRVMQTENKSMDGEFGLSDTEKEQILGKIEEAANNIQNDIDDIQLDIQEASR
jgi:DNA polymerase III delta prime subunit